MEINLNKHLDKSKRKTTEYEGNKIKGEQIPAYAFGTSIQSPLRRMAHFATRHSSQFVPPHNPVSQVQVTPLR
jgi:hypothetical protein